MNRNTQAASERWWHRPFRILQTNLREIDAGLDVDRVLAELRDLNANVWLLNAGGIVSFYPSQLPYQQPSPWLRDRPSGDLIGDAVAAAHAAGVRVVARLDFSKLHADLYAAHPDWFFVNGAGQPQEYNGLYSTDPCAPYYQELSFEIIAELVRRYDVDGFFFNMFGFKETDYSGNYHGLSRNVHSVRRFRAEHGGELPESADWNHPSWVDYLDFRWSVVTALTRKVRAFLNAQKPDAALVLFMNAGRGDVVMHEINNAVARAGPFWAHGAAEAIKHSNGEYPDAPVTINSVLFLDIPYRFAAEQPGMVAVRLAQTIAHGANPYIYVIGADTSHYRGNLPVCRELLGFQSAHEDAFTGLRSVARIALVKPDLTAERYRAGTQSAHLQAAFRGCYLALMNRHEQFDIISDRSLDGDDESLLDRYRVLVLPNVACISDTAVGRIESFVARGGAVLATFETGRYDERGRDRPEAAGGWLAGGRVQARRADTRGAYLALAEDSRVISPAAAAAAAAGAGLMPLIGELLYVEPGESVQADLLLVSSAPYGPPEKCYGHLPTEWPGALTRAVGAGRSVWLPWQPDRYYFENRIPEYGVLISHLVRSLDAAPPHATSTAPRVEIVVREQPRTGAVLVSLINHSGHDGHEFGAPVPMHGVEVSVALPGVGGAWSAVSLRLARGLAMAADGERQVVTLPSLELFDTIRFTTDGR